MAEAKKQKRKISDKELCFIQEYLVDLNQTKAAIRAGYSPRSAYDIGSRLMKKPDIRARVDMALAERSKRTGINADRVLRELAKVAFCNPAQVLDMDTADVLGTATADDTACIQSVKVKYVPVKRYDEDGEMHVVEAIEREVRFNDKLKALDQLCRHLGIDGRSVARRAGDAAAADQEDAAQSGVVVLPEVEALTPPAAEEPAPADPAPEGPA